MKHQAHENEIEQQLNREPEQKESEDFSLEDIMREFGGWSKPAEDPQPPETEKPAEAAAEETIEEAPPEEASERPQAGEQAPEPPGKEDKPEERRSRFQFIKLDLSGKASEPENEMPAAQDTKEPEPDASKAPEPSEPSQEEKQEEKKEGTPEASAKKVKKQVKKPELKVLPKPERTHRPKKKRQTVHIDPAEAYASGRKGMAGRTLRTYLSFIPAVLSIFLTLWVQYDWNLPISAPKTGLRNGMLLILMLLSVLFDADVLLSGVKNALRLRWNLQSSLTLCTLVVLADTLGALGLERVPFTAPICLLLAIAEWGSLLQKSADLRTLRTVTEANEPEVVLGAKELWHGQDCVLHRPGSTDAAADQLAEADGCEKAMRVYCPVCAAAGVVLACVIAVVTETSVLWVLSVILLGSIPVMGFFCYPLAWQMLSRRLRKSGAALFGWAGSREVRNQRYLVICGSDLFPKANVTLNGLKVCGNYRVKQIVTYAGTVIAAAGSELEPLFNDLMQEYGARSMAVGSFRRYEGGGCGAEIAGDVVLVGSIRFMQLMGIHVPAELDLRQAVYLSINGELAGVFAVSYKASGSVRSALLAIQHSKTLTPLLATKDFLLSPQMLGKKYKISSDRIEFPAVADRAALLETAKPSDSTPAAVLTRGSLSGYSGAVLGARALRSVTRWASAFCYISGVTGFLIMLLLTRVGAEATASASNLTLYLLLWILPSLLLATWVKK